MCIIQVANIKQFGTNLSKRKENLCLGSEVRIKSREGPFLPTEKLIATDDFLLLSSDSALELSKRKHGNEMISEAHFERGAIFLSLDFMERIIRHIGEKGPNS